MDSNMTVRVRITHTQNLPSAQGLANIMGRLLTEALASDPLLKATVSLESTAIEQDDSAPLVRPAGPTIYGER